VGIEPCAVARVRREWPASLGADRADDDLGAIGKLLIDALEAANQVVDGLLGAVGLPAGTHQAVFASWPAHGVEQKARMRVADAERAKRVDVVERIGNGRGLRVRHARGFAGFPGGRFWPRGAAMRFVFQPRAVYSRGRSGFAASI